MRSLRAFTGLGRRARLLLLVCIAGGGCAAVLAVPGGAAADHHGRGVYTQANLISDIPGVARITDANLVNPWGMAAGDSTPLWIADNGADVSTLYSGAVHGSIPTIVPLVVSIPGGAPTGTVFNPTSSFVVTNGGASAPANFIFASEAGMITAWSKTVSGTSAQTEVTSATAVYKGLAIASTSGGPMIYATNFHDGTVDVFDGSFHPVVMPGAFADPSLPAGYAPFGIQELGGALVVSYALQDADKHDDVRGAGHGFVDVYDTSGHLLRRLISGGDLNSPWGMVIAPHDFGAFSRDLLVGNFGDGAIHAYNPRTGAERGQLINGDGNRIMINGLWGLRFGNGVMGTRHTLLFTAGIGDESHGLFGEITAREDH